MKGTIQSVAEQLQQARETEPLFSNHRPIHMPRRQAVADVLMDIRSVLFPGYYPIEGAPITIA